MAEGDRRIDIERLKSLVSIVDIVREVVDLKPAGNQLQGLCPFHKERTPSFGVRPDKRYFKCFGCGAHGDVISFVERYQKVTFLEAAEYLANRVGLMPATASARPLKPMAPPPEPDSLDEEEEQQDRLAAALGIWNASIPSSGTLAELYLQCRGINVTRLGGMPPSIRFHPSLYHSNSGKRFPAMVAAMQGADRGIYGVHRTYIALRAAEHYPKQQKLLAAVMGVPDADIDRLVTQVVVKAPVSPAKKMKGISKGSCVRLCHAGPVMCIAEGIETAYSILRATGYPTWAALSLGNMGGIALPAHVQEVILCADSDAKDPAKAEAQLQRAADAYQLQRKIVRIARPHRGSDFNDMLAQGVT